MGGRVPRDHAQRRDPAAMAAGIRDRAFHATEAVPLSVAGTEIYVGALLLLDNLPHDWLEGRGLAPGVS